MQRHRRAPKKALTWVVEHRCLDAPSSEKFETVIMHLASSKERAIKFMKRSRGADPSDRWWWAVYTMVVDDYGDCEDNLAFFDQEAKQLDFQPYKPEDGSVRRGTPRRSKNDESSDASQRPSA